MFSDVVSRAESFCCRHLGAKEHVVRALHAQHQRVVLVAHLQKVQVLSRQDTFSKNHLYVGRCERWGGMRALWLTQSPQAWDARATSQVRMASDGRKLLAPPRTCSCQSGRGSICPACAARAAPAPARRPAPGWASGTRAPAACGQGHIIDGHLPRPLQHRLSGLSRTAATCTHAPSACGRGTA